MLISKIIAVGTQKKEEVNDTLTIMYPVADFTLPDPDVDVPDNPEIPGKMEEQNNTSSRL